MQKLIEAYLAHLSTDPERVDSLLMWTICTFTVWLVIWLFRKQFLAGLAGDGKHPGDTAPDNLDAREQILFIFYFIPPPVIFNAAFFHHVETWMMVVMWAVLAPLYYQIFGRFIFDWAIIAWRAFRGQPEKEVTDLSLKAEDKK